MVGSGKKTVVREEIGLPVCEFARNGCEKYSRLVKDSVSEDPSRSEDSLIHLDEICGSDTYSFQICYKTSCADPIFLIMREAVEALREGRSFYEVS